MHIEECRRGVHLAEEPVQDGLGTYNVAILVELDAADEVLEVFLHEEQVTEKTRMF